MQSLANLERTGKLVLSHEEEQAIVLLRHGKILHAATSSIREALGSLLVGEKLITEEELVAAVAIQEKADQEQRLGNILVDQGHLGRDDLERVLTQKSQRVILELLQWKHGFFEFRPVEIKDHGEFETDVSDLPLRDGLTVESLLLSGAFELDRLAMEDRPLDNETPESEEQTDESNQGSSSLRTLMNEIRSPELTGELNARIMDYASQLFSRIVLFSVKRDYFYGIGFFGAGLDQQSVAAVRQMRIPLSEPSILATASAQRTTFRRPLTDDPWN